MGFVDKLKSIITWESMVTLIFFFGCLTAIGIIGIVYDNMVVYVGVLVAFGIPTSIFGNMAARIPIPTTSNTNSTPKKEIDELRISIANLLNEVLLLKNKIGENNNE